MKHISSRHGTESHKLYFHALYQMAGCYGGEILYRKLLDYILVIDCCVLVVTGRRRSGVQEFIISFKTDTPSRTTLRVWFTLMF